MELVEEMGWKSRFRMRLWKELCLVQSREMGLQRPENLQWKPQGFCFLCAWQQTQSPSLLYVGSGDRIFSLDANYCFQTITLLLCHFNFIRKPLGHSPTFAVDQDPRLLFPFYLTFRLISNIKLKTADDTCNSNTHEAVAGWLWVPGQPGLCNELEARSGFKKEERW